MSTIMFFDFICPVQRAGGGGGREFWLTPPPSKKQDFSTNQMSDINKEELLIVLDSIFKKISKQIKTNSNPRKLIDDKISRESFKRLN